MTYGNALGIRENSGQNLRQRVRMHFVRFVHDISNNKGDRGNLT